MKSLENKSITELEKAGGKLNILWKVRNKCAVIRCDRIKARGCDGMCRPHFNKVNTPFVSN